MLNSIRPSPLLSKSLLVATAVMLSPPSAVADDTLKIGIIHSLTGSMAHVERPLRDVLLMLVDEQNKKGGVLGKKIEAVSVDAGSNWPLFPEKARELIIKDKVDALFGGLAFVSYKAMLPVVKETKHILFFPGLDDGNDKEPTVFYTGGTPDQLLVPAVELLSKQQKIERWALIGTDVEFIARQNRYVADRLKSSLFKQDDVLTRSVPFSHTDWRSALPELPTVGPFAKRTALLTTLPNVDDNVSLHRELRDRNLTAKSLPVLSYALDDALLAATDAQRFSGVSAARSYFQSVDTPANRELVRLWKDFRDRNVESGSVSKNAAISAAMESHAIGFAMWIKAVEMAKSAEPERVRAALPGIEVPNFSGGTAKMLESHRITKAVYLAEVSDKGDLEIAGRTASTGNEKALATSATSSPDLQPQRHLSTLAPTYYSPPYSPPTPVQPTPRRAPELPPSVQPNRPNFPSSSGGLNQQTKPGEGGSGEVAAPSPTPSGPSNEGPPNYPPPKLGDSGGGKKRCLEPTDLRVAPAAEFHGSDKPIAYCKDGFSDVVLIDTADPRQISNNRVCTGVRIETRWVLTALHCVKNWSATGGRVFVLTSGDADCLDNLAPHLRHPGESCNLTEFKRRGQPVKGPSLDIRQVDLALIPIEASALPRKIASIRRFAFNAPFELTLPGFGARPGAAAAGRFQVGYAQIVNADVLEGFAHGALTDGLEDPQIPIQFVVGANQGSWACGGDSGAPLLAGRRFGYVNEPHSVIGIVSASSFADGRCRPNAGSINDKQKVTSLMDPKVAAWLCEQTDRSLDICKSTAGASAR
jgi:urea transport system substrate-binding protein